MSDTTNLGNVDVAGIFSEAEERTKHTPAPTLVQACNVFRAFEEKTDLHETNQGERYLTAMVINPTIQYALTPMFGKKGNLTLKEASKVYKNGVYDDQSSQKAYKKAILSYMHSRYAAIPYQNFQQKQEVLQHDFNRVFRYIDSEYRQMKTHPVSAEVEYAGRKRTITPTLTHECGNQIDIFQIKLGKSHFTQSGRKNEFNRDMQLYELVLYGRARGFEHIRAHFLYLTRKDDTAEWFGCEPYFFAGGGENDITMSDVWLGEPNDLDARMEEKVKLFADGVEEETMPEDECLYCRYAKICRMTLPPVRLEAEEEITVSTDTSKIEFSALQEKIRTFDHGIMRVIATAGSGKTFTSMAHVAYLVKEKGVDPQDICLVTFSNAGAKEMSRKLSRMLGYDPEEHGMKITTFHGLFYEIVKDKWEDLGFGHFPRVLNTVERYAQIADLLAKNPIFEWKGVSFRNFSVKKGGYNDVGALAVVSDIFTQIKRLGKDPADVQFSEIRTYCDIPAAAVVKVIGLYSKYEEYCKEEGLLDFDDMELLAFQVIEEDPSYLESRYTFRHSVIDEFQDTSLYEMEMVKRLKMLPTFESMMIVGDDDQSIYGFRDTSPEYILNFERLINDQYVLRTDTDTVQPTVRIGDAVEDVVLDVNYRSHQEIIDLGCAMLEPNQDKFAKDIQAARGNGGSTLVRGHMDKKHMLDWMVRSIKSQIDHGVKYEDICVLAYKKSKLRDVADALTQAGIPSMMGAPEPMSDNSRIDSILAFARVLLDPTDTLDAAKAAAALYYAEDPTTEVKFMHLEKDDLDARIAEVLDRVSAINGGMSEAEQKAALLQYIADISLDDEAVTHFAEPFETMDYEDILKYCRDFTLYGVNEEFRRLDEYPGVKLITAHSSKGLEWPVVYLDLTDFSDIPFRHRSEQEEIRRLMYVSMTRARDQLFVTGIFMKNGKKLGEQIVNWCLSEAYHAARLDFDHDFLVASVDAAAEKAAARKAKQKEKEQLKTKKTGTSSSRRRTGTANKK